MTLLLDFSILAFLAIVGIDVAQHRLKNSKNIKMNNNDHP